MLTDEQHRAEQATADASGDPTLVSTPAQRRADATVELCRRALAADPDRTTPAIPLITATIDVETLERRANRAAELDGGGHLTAQAARRLACDAGIARLIVGPDSVPLDLGRTTRTVSPAQRRALTRRDRGCIFPGCDRPAGWCHAHHITWWTRDGPTDLQNLCLLCSHHHHLVHDGSFGLTRLSNGDLRFTRPDGTPIVIPPLAA